MESFLRHLRFYTFLTLYHESSEEEYQKAEPGKVPAINIGLKKQAICVTNMRVSVARRTSITVLLQLNK